MAEQIVRSDLEERGVAYQTNNLHRHRSPTARPGFAAGDLNHLSGPVRQNGPDERRHLGDRAARGSASSSPPNLKLCSRPSSLRRVTVVPKDALLLSAGGLTNSALARRALQ
jgi:hypothetical protein